MHDNLIICIKNNKYMYMYNIDVYLIENALNFGLEIDLNFGTVFFYLTF